MSTKDTTKETKQHWNWLCWT